MVLLNQEVITMKKSVKILQLKLPFDLDKKLAELAKKNQTSKNKIIIDLLNNQITGLEARKLLDEIKNEIKPEDAPDWFNKPASEYIKELRSDG